MNDIITCFNNLLNVCFQFIPSPVFAIAIPFAGIYALIKFMRR